LTFLWHPVIIARNSVVSEFFTGTLII
jgi:hypothetical protein